MKPSSLILLAAGALTAATPLVLGGFPTPPPDAAALKAATQAFLDSLDSRQRKAAVFAFDADERKNWHFVPRIYPGVALGQLGVTQRRALHKMLGTALSASGYHKTTTIMRLEDLLRKLAENQGRKAPHRDPGRYALAVFGRPDPLKPWGFRFQGHHISLNVTVIDGKIAATTPTFLGANPGEIRHGTYAGLRALPDEEDLGFALLHSLTPEQRAVAILHKEAPRDVIFGPDRKADVLGAPQGLAATALTKPQRQLLEQLLDTYLDNVRQPIAAFHRARIEAAGMAKVSFAWMGATQRGEGHYYRIHGPTFVVEYDNTQNGANHVHCVFHDLTNNFGGDLLHEHYQRHHDKKRIR